MPLKIVRFKCTACGKVTAGRLPVNPHNHRERGDGSEMYPRRHYDKQGNLCEGCFEFAKWVELDLNWKEKK